jgi:thiol-disulfide isomerase/thioredoxin
MIPPKIISFNERFCMTRSIVSMLFVFSLVISSASCQETKKLPSLDDAHSFTEIETYIKAVHAQMESRVTSADELFKRQKSIIELSVAAAEKMIKVAQNDKERETGYKMQIDCLDYQDKFEKETLIQQLAKEQGITEYTPDVAEKIAPLILKADALETEAQKRLITTLEMLKKEDKFPDILHQGQVILFQINTKKLAADFSQEKFEHTKKEAKDWINQGEEQVLLLVLEAIEFKEVTDTNSKIAAQTVSELSAFLKSTECTLSEVKKNELIETLEGRARRMTGADLKLYGKTLDNKDFDWSALRDKYVLVKFTASWCGPCRGEIPGMLDAYEKYHNKGFEIVSVYIWDKLADSKRIVKKEKLPWLTISEELTEKAGQPPQGNAYFIQGVPTMLLVGKDGKVINADIRGQQLKKRLAELLGK